MSDYLAPLWKLLVEQAGESEIQSCGQKVGRVLETELTELNRQKRILDEILGWKAPTTTAWQSLGRPVVGDPFAEAVQDVLKELVITGTRRVDTKLVHGKVIERGVQNGRKNPRTAIGNIVIRTRGWKKVSQGVYQFQGDRPDGIDNKTNAER